MSAQIIRQHFEAGELVDLPGHCKLCGATAPDESPHLMHDPYGKGDPLVFCSAACLHNAEHLFDGLDAENLALLDVAIGVVEARTAVLS